MPNKAYYFDGVNDYMENAIPSFQFGEDSSFTISFWISKNNTTNKGWVYHYGLNQNQGGTNNFCQYFSANANAEAQWRTNKQGQPWINLYSTYTANTWEHFAVTFENKIMTIYKNGAQYGTSITYTYTGALTATMPFRIGVSFNLSNSYGGKIDDFGIWSRKLTSNEISNLYNPCTIVYGPAATITACGSYNSQSGTNYTTTGQYSDTLQTSTSCDSVITLNLTINNATTSTDVQIACDTYTWINGNAYTSNNNTATYITTNSNGCDSVITLDLTITGNPIATVSQVGLDLDASVVGGNTPYTYQWNTTETTQQITPTANGTYWVIVEDINQCISDTIYFNVTWISTDITELNIVVLSIYPNPSDDIFNIVFNSNTKQDIDLRIHNVLGEVIFSEKLTDFSGDYNRTVDMTGYPNAIYILQLNTKDGMLNRKLVLEK